MPRQQNAEYSATSRGIVHVQRCVVARGEQLGNREPKAGVARFAAPAGEARERLENA